MDGAGLESFIRNQTGATTNDVSQSDLFEYVNIIREDIRAEIEARLGFDFWYTVYTASSVSGQSEYDLYNDFTGTGKVFSVDRLEIKWNDTDARRSIVDSGSVDDYGVSVDYLEQNISEDESFYENRGAKLYIYPASSDSVTDGIKLWGLYTFDDVDQTSTIDEMYPGHPELNKYIHLIGLGTIPYVERHRNVKDKNDIMASESMYKDQLDKLIRGLKKRYNGTQYGALPDNTYLTR